MNQEAKLRSDELQNIAGDLRKFLDETRIPEEEFKSMTLSSYDDVQKWEAIIEEIKATFLNYTAYSMPLLKWKVNDTIRWLS